MSAESGYQIFVPIGFTYGFIALESECDVIYKCSDTYAPEAEGGIRWNDPGIGIVWPIPAGTPSELSDKDVNQPLLADSDSPFAYDGHPLELLA